MSANKQDTKVAWVDPDDAPELSDEWFDGADVHDNGVLIRRGRGRPRVAKPKQQITLRLDADRHLQLRLASALAGRSAQQLLTEALDSMIAGLPEVADMAARAGNRNRHS